MDWVIWMRLPDAGDKIKGLGAGQRAAAHCPHYSKLPAA